MNRVIVLGSGASTGVPMIGCKCSVCTSKSKYNKRLRPSILIQYNRKNILVDVGPDFREQALKYDIDRVDALIITHSHYDHIAGLDDLRAYNRVQKSFIRCYLLKQTFQEIEKKYDHFFSPNYKNHTQSAKFDFHILDDKKTKFRFANTSIETVFYFQDSKKVLGFRLGNFAYITDIKRYEEKILEKLQNLDILVLSCLRKQRSQVHFNLKEAKGFVKKVKAKKTFLTHLAHEVDFLKLSKYLPKNIQLAYDGLILDL